MRISALVLVWSLLGLTAYAQKVSYKASLPQVLDDGFYKVVLPPEITGGCKEDLSDLRIYDSKGKEVRYMVKPGIAEGTSTFHTYKISKRRINPGKTSYILLENSGKKSINNINLKIRNADVVKEIRLTGSDDEQTWYVIKDRDQLHSVANSESTSTLKILDFPLVDYQHLRLEINDSLSPPINILEAGYYSYVQDQTQLIELPAPKITQIDSSDHNSYCYLHFNLPYNIDRLTFQFSGSNYFYRNASLSTIHKYNKSSYFTFLSSFPLSSAGSNTLDHQRIKSSDLCLIIENEDNPPLTLTNVKIYAKQDTLISYFFKDFDYQLRYGNDKLQSPNYDLVHFKDSVPANATVIHPGKSVRQVQKTSKPEKENFFQSKGWIWAAIGLVSMLLLYMTFRMIKDLR